MLGTWATLGAQSKSKSEPNGDDNSNRNTSSDKMYTRTSSRGHKDLGHVGGLGSSCFSFPSGESRNFLLVVRNLCSLAYNS